MTNKVEGPQDPRRSDEMKPFPPEHRRVQKVEKVRKVDEAENEQRARKKFRQYMSEDDDENMQGPRLPTPFETNFYSLNEEDNKGRPVPSPAYSSAPDVTQYQPEEGSEEEALPHAKDFWKTAGALPDPSQKTPHYLETGLRYESAEEFKARKKKEQQVIGKEETEKAAHKAKKKEREKAGIFLKEVPGRGDEEDTKEKKGKVQAKKRKRGEEEVTAAPQSPLKLDEGRSPKKSSPKVDANNLPPAHTMSQNPGDKNFGKGKQTREIAPPSNTPLPPAAAMAAQTAAVHATPYLNPEVLPLFFQMVGSIYVLAARSGITRTEILLDAASFASSKFYGAKIVIEKYATAPDSVNIRLTGPQAAVTAFNQNIPALWNAFQKGKFSFRVGRLDVEYGGVDDRPLFRRKEASKDKGEAGGGDLHGGRH